MKNSCPNRWISFLILLGALLGLVTPVLGETIGPVAAGFVLDGALKEWTKQSPTLSLIPKSAGARPGTVWIAQSPKGLVIAGRVKGPPPVFAKSAEDMPNGDHVEIWAAIVEKVPLPPIGAHSFMDGAVELYSPEDCQEDDACKTWFADQVQHRRLLPRLFARQWQLAPGVTVETYARPAWEAMRVEARESYQYLLPRISFSSHDAGESHQYLLPRGLPETRFATNPPDGYGFEVLIPWEALPPSNRLSLDRLRVLVEVFSPGSQGKYGAFGTTSGIRQYGRVKTMNAMALAPPRRWRLTPCGYPLEEKNFWARFGMESTEEYKPKKLPAYFLPTGKDEITIRFTLDNEYIGRWWSPGGLSPVIVTTEFFSRRLAPGLTLCGPDLAVRRGRQAHFGKGFRIEPNTRTQKTSGGWLLVGGPLAGGFREPHGQCGACEDKYLNMIFIPEAAGPPSSAFQASGIECDCCGVGHCIVDITLADDFGIIRVTGGSDFEATRKTSKFCFNAVKHAYLPCKLKIR